ncbi:MAG TPA: alkaline phosphatase family protein [Thermoanaerobaculia bacterium]|nr:alkaline phosphatase family protein [Thermoanaerobaculia bacterium]
MLRRPICPLFLCLVLTLSACRAREAPPPETVMEEPAAARAAGGPAVTPPPPTVPEIAAAAKPGRKVILLGLDGADWELLDGYIAAGKMPNLARLVREGRSGTLAAFQPSLCPLLWTTSVTGVSPLEHGILDYTRISPEGEKEEPVTSAERRVPAVWDMATAAGRSVAVLGMWGTYPAEPVRGLVVSDLWLAFDPKPNEMLPAGVVYPAEAEEWARTSLRQAYNDRGGYEALAPWLPGLRQTDFENQAAQPDPYAHPVSALRQIRLETAAMGTPVTARLTADKPDLAIIYLQGPDTAGHVFAPFAPPRQEAVSAADFQRYGGVPERYFAEVDRLLGMYREAAEATGVVLMLASDHGFLWKEGRPDRPGSASAQVGGQWHRPEGIYLLWGPGIEKRSAREAGALDQVTPTLLALLGLPPARGLAGRPLPGVKASSASAADYRAHFRPGKPAPGEQTRTVTSYNNEGLLLREKGEPEKAAAAFEKALAKEPDDAAALWNLSDLLFSTVGDDRQKDRADELLMKALQAGLPAGTQRTIGRAVAYQKDGDLNRALRLLDAAVEVQPREPTLWLFRGRYRIDSGRCPDALEDLRRARDLDDKNPLTYGALGLTRQCLGDIPGAVREYEKALDLDPGQSEIRQYLREITGGPAAPGNAGGF